MRHLWQELERFLTQHDRAALLLVASSVGSAPGKLGFKMILAPNGVQHGTIGGGIMEHKLARRLMDAMAAGNTGTDLIKQVHRANAPEQDRSGMICAGSQEIVTCLLDRDSLAAIQSLAAAEARQEGKMLTLSRSGLRVSRPDDDPVGLRASETDQWLYREVVCRQDRVYVIGGGHVGLALCRALAPLDLRVICCDHRPDVATVVENHWADDMIITPYEALGDVVPEGRHVYVVIVTTAMPYDAESLYQVIGKKVGFLGLMGSKAKLARIFGILEERGVDKALFDTVHAPVGLNINNRTPAEIGISIAAQIISLRNG